VSIGFFKPLGLLMDLFGHYQTWLCNLDSDESWLLGQFTRSSLEYDVVTVFTLRLLLLLAYNANLQSEPHLGRVHGSFT
jgi:hypothetical protein